MALKRWTFVSAKPLCIDNLCTCFSILCCGRWFTGIVDRSREYSIWQHYCRVLLEIWPGPQIATWSWDWNLWEHNLNGARLFLSRGTDHAWIFKLSVHLDLRTLSCNALVYFFDSVPKSHFTYSIVHLKLCLLFQSLSAIAHDVVQAWFWVFYPNYLAVPRTGQLWAEISFWWSEQAGTGWSDQRHP